MESRMLKYFVRKSDELITDAISTGSIALHHHLGRKLRNRSSLFHGEQYQRTIFNGTSTASENGTGPGLGNASCANGDAVTDTPLHPKPDSKIINPVLTASDVTDFGEVDFVADPFLYIENDSCHLFFEVMNRDQDPNTAIGHAMSSDYGRSWYYNQLVLHTGRHISFPFVFKYEQEHYMLPEQYFQEEQRIELYRAEDFPTEWKLQETLVSPSHIVQDAVLFQYEGYWWLLVGSGQYDTTYLYYSQTLVNGTWTSHPMNPVVSDRQWAAKPAGRPFVSPDQLIVFYQDCVPEYGKRVRAFELTSLNPTEYVDVEHSKSPILGPKAWPQWCSGRMHHFDAWHIGDDRWLCAVDGDIGFPRRYLTGAHWSIGVFTASR